MLKVYLDILNNPNLADDSPMVASAICQWYNNLEIEMKPEMRVSLERVRLLKVLEYLHAKVDEYVEERTATTFLSRFGLRMRKFCRNFTRSFNPKNATKVSVLFAFGFVMYRLYKKN